MLCKCPHPSVFNPSLITYMVSLQLFLPTVLDITNLNPHQNHLESLIIPLFYVPHSLGVGPELLYFIL